MNLELIIDYMNKVWNQKKFDTFDDIFSEDALIHSPLGDFKTPQAMKETTQKWIDAIPDVQVEFLHTIEKDDFVIIHWKAKGYPSKRASWHHSFRKACRVQMDIDVPLKRWQNCRVLCLS